MIQLLHSCVLLSLTAKYATANTSVIVSLAMMTVSDYTHLTCCHPCQHVSRCYFYIDSGEIGQETARNCCCDHLVSGQQLLEGKAEQQLLSAVNVHCVTQLDYGNNSTSTNVTVTVWRLPLSGKHAVILLLVFGALVLFCLLIFISVCIWYCVTKKQGRKRQFQPVRSQELDTDTQGVNHGIEEEQEDRSEVEELFYATVSHTSFDGVSSTVKFESGTDYATVVVN
ncbi:uncharacterized protein LOC130570010 isoform X2 [Triplophysa rosa]|uniref:Uncharacterized protein n=1 Tax=Triplophysa rosa TaxID=992332 RepID=A0A9W7TFU6_TRIRA|nr:uncharacterized protein LOC130570010 isoform X2 [Triplophysa rosa]KAI7796169.1 hypothetical protein IRJ41_017955 [Triplophysa rosa]